MRYAVLFAAAALGVATAAEAQAPAGELKISGTSTVRSWSCKAPEYDARLRAGPGFEDAVLGGTKAVDHVRLAVPVGEIECGNGKMNDHLRKALKAEAHPTITYELSAYDIARAAQGVTVESTGKLTIAGATQPIEMAVAVTKGETGGIRVRGEKVVRMTEFGVKPPTLMLGTLKVGDEVRVSFDMILGPGAALSDSRGNR